MMMVHARALSLSVSEALSELELNIYGALQIGSFYITYTVKLSHKSSQKLSSRRKRSVYFTLLGSV